MTAILKSPAYYAGSEALSTDLSYGYTDYVAMAAALGYTIIDATITEDAFDFFTTNSIHPAQPVCGAAFAVKLGGTKVLGVLGLDGVPWVPSATQPRDGPFFNDSGSFPFLHFNGVSNSRYLQRSIQSPLIAKGAPGFALAMSARNDVQADSLYPTLFAQKDASTNYPCAGIEAYNNDFTVSRTDVFVVDSAYNPAAALETSTRETANIPSYADWMAVVGHIKLSDLTLRTYNDGAASGTKVVAPGLYAYETNPVRLVLSCTGSTRSTFNKNSYAEWGVITNCTETQAAAWGTRMAALY